MYITKNFGSEELNGLVKMLMESGATPEELSILSIMTMMDDTLQAFREDEKYAPLVKDTYATIDQYISQRGLEN